MSEQLVKESIKAKLQQLTHHRHTAIVSRGDAAIKAALQLFDSVLIPEEGGWLSYKKLPKSYAEIECSDSKIDLASLTEKLKQNKFSAFLYQNPGGYFAEQPGEKIYELCHRYNCKVIIDVSGAIGTKLGWGDYADILVCSCGRWKLVDAGKGGFISSRDERLFKKLTLNEFDDEEVLEIINHKLNYLSQRIAFILEKRKQIITDLNSFKILHKNDFGSVVIVEFSDLAKTERDESGGSKLSQRESLINYCAKNNLPWTECPRYIRVNKPAISIEVKQL